jgi:putative PIG3 family NAD(P)H quinone oxidoreductase
MNLPQSMHGIEITRIGPPDVLATTTRPVPIPGHDEVLVRVEAIGVCRPDSLQRRGLHPPPQGASDLPGLEVAGTVAALGEGVDRWRVGDAVCALLPGGGYAQYAVAHQLTVLPVPKGWTTVEAATLPENMFTVWDNVFHRARLGAGETLLVHGGTSGIGSTAIMLARAFGATALATAGSAEKCQACVRIGAAAAINYREEDFVPRVLELTDGRGVDVVVDIVGGEYIARSLKVLALDGRIVHLATQGPDKRATIDMSQLIQRRASLIASGLRWRSPQEKGAIAAQLLSHVWPRLAERTHIVPVVDSVHPLADAARVHAYFDSGTHVGKIVMVP